MAEVLLFTKSQKEELAGIYNGEELMPIKDANGNWVVSVRVIENESFVEIRDILKSLPIIDYKPVTENIL